ncbi:DUF5696 domain-containing protein, partial [Paenibacillus sp. 598K]|uniref:DUF5696 domain-containing protein n=1 Tax=Paenibacillus sp. 598K TaxID=1117987 RepID=UPI001629D328
PAASNPTPDAEPNQAEQPGSPSDQPVVSPLAVRLTGDEPMYPVTATTRYLDNGRFVLYLDEKTANVRVAAKDSEAEWLGAPIVPRTTMPNNKKFMDSPVHVKYTEGADITSTYSLKDAETTATIAAEADRVKVSFAFELEQLYFDLVYRLTDTGLEVTIPYDSIREEGKARLISLEALPFMNAALPFEEGAMLLPDGSGALLHFRPDYPLYLKGYSEMIYGPDETFITQTHDMISQNGMRTQTPRQYATMPVYGMYRDGIGTLGIVTQGEYDARINGTPAGIRNIPLYRSSAEFLYRKNDVIFIGSSGQIPYYQGRKIEGDRQVRFELLTGEEASYVGLAGAYRRYLTDELGVKPIGARAADAPLSIRMLGGIRRDEIIGSTFIRMTTFEQAQRLIAELKSAGIYRLELTLDGWSKGGLYGNQPEHFPAARQLGGRSGLKRLAAYAAEQDTPLYLRTNYVKPFESSDGFSQRKDAVRGIDREVLELTGYYLTDRWTQRNIGYYLLKPQRVYDRHIALELAQADKLGVAGIQFQHMGDLLYSDEDPAAFFSRAQTAAVWRQALETAREQVGRAAVDYGYAYTWGAVNRIDQAPLYHSGYTYTDEAVPFYQLAIHGLIPYYAAPANLREDAAYERLRAIEYGALPSYELTAAPTNRLQRTMADRLFSSQAEDWLGEAISEYKAMLPMYEATAGRRMIGHSQLQPGIYSTDYEGGVRVIVNYNATDAQVDGQPVRAMDYTWMRG